MPIYVYNKAPYHTWRTISPSLICYGGERGIVMKKCTPKMSETTKPFRESHWLDRYVVADGHVAWDRLKQALAVGVDMPQGEIAANDDWEDFASKILMHSVQKDSEFRR